MEVVIECEFIMVAHISRVQISNFRNFKDLDVYLSEKAVIVGENKSGKTNFIHSLRLILDPELPDSSRHLTEEDFWDGLESPMATGEKVRIIIDIKDFEDSNTLLAILQDYLISSDPPTARLTYEFRPSTYLDSINEDSGENKYEFVVFGGDVESKVFGYQQRKWMPLQVLPALRDAERDLETWKKSPLRPLIDRLNVTIKDLESAANKIDEATEEILTLEDVNSLSEAIEKRLEDMIGEFHSVSPSLGIATTDALRLLRSLRLFVDGNRKRLIGDTSLGICNIIYLTLLSLELEQKEIANERALTILAIEEPEAHIHPHLQRLVYYDFLRRDSSVILTTHSPHIISVSPLQSVVLLKDCGPEDGSKATSTKNVNFSTEQVQDIERYLDATRGEMFFARGVILVEGTAELYIIPAFANAMNISLDQLGISVCSVHGTDFAPYVRLLKKNALKIPFVVVTDGDPYSKNEDIRYRGLDRGMKLLEDNIPDKVQEIGKLFKKGEWDEVDERLKKYRIYVGEHTLEIDLANSGFKKEMLNTLIELGAGKVQQKKFQTALSNNDKLKEADINQILKRIEIYGKGRYAQRLAPKLNSENIPPYIELAIKKIVSIVSNSS